MQVSIPASLARCAKRPPARLACSIGSSSCSSGSVHATAASVAPERSSMSWANIPRFERNTASRGRSAVPLTLARTRRRRRSLLWCLVTTVRGGASFRGVLSWEESPPLRPLPDLAADVLALVANALALVRLGRPGAANPRGDLSDELLVDPPHDDPRRARELELHPLGRRHRDRVRVADVQLQRLSLQAPPIAHAVDLEPALVPLRDPLHHVRDQAPREAVQRAVLAAVRRPLHGQGAVGLGDGHIGAHRLTQLALRTLDLNEPRPHLNGDAVGNRDWLLADPAHGRILGIGYGVLVNTQYLVPNTCSPHIGHNLTADATLPRLVPGHDPGRGAQDRGAHAAHHARDLPSGDVVAPARARDPLKAGDHGPATVGVLEPDPDHLPDGSRLDGESLDVALLLEDPRHLALELGRGNLDRGVLRRDRVAKLGQVVGYGVGEHASLLVTNSTWSCRGCSPCGPARARRACTGRTCGSRPAGARTGGSGCAPGSGTWACAGA